MAILSDRDKMELLQDAESKGRRDNFRQIDVRSHPLTPSAFIEFLTWTNKLHGARARTLAIKGDHFLM